MVPRTGALLGWAAVVAVTGCNEILGIDDRHPKPATASSSSAAGTGGQGGQAGHGGSGAGADVLWARNFGDVTPEQAYRVAVDSQGGVLVGCAFSGILSFDVVLEGTGLADGCALKLTSDGVPEWSVHLSGAGMQFVHAVAFAAGDDAYVAGSFEGETNVSTATSQGLFALQLSGGGKSISKYAWTEGSLNDLLVDDDGFSVFGVFSQALQFPPEPTMTTSQGAHGFAAAIDSTGSAAWSQQLAAGSGSVALVRAARAGAYTFLAGYMESSSNAMPYAITIANANGALTATVLTSPDNARVLDIAVAADGTAFLAGAFSGELTLGESTVTSQDEDIFVAAIDGGNVLWLRSYGGPGADTAHAIEITPGGVALAGFLASGIAFADGPPLEHFEGADAFVVELTAEGDFVKGITLGGPATQEARDIAFSPTGELLVTGVMEETLSVHDATLFSAGMTDIFIAKLRW